MGPAEAVRKVHIFIMEKIREKPDPSPKPEDAKTNYERHRQVIEVFQPFFIIIPSFPTSCFMEDLAFLFCTVSHCHSRV